MLSVTHVIILGKFVSFSLCATTTNRTNVDQAFAEFDERPTLSRQYQLAHVAQCIVDKILNQLLTQMVHDTLFVY